MDMQSYFDTHFYNLDSKAIYSLNNIDTGAINNVITNLNDRCYGVHVYDDKEFIEYLIFYIENKNALQGLGLRLTMELDFTTRMLYTIEFCKLVEEKFPNADIIDTFNTLQQQTRTQFEKMGFFTIGNEIYKKLKGQKVSLMVKGHKGVLSFPTFDKIHLYRWFFNENQDEVFIDSSKVKKVYLLLDSSNNLIKIGQSYYPSLREKTLHGIAPRWDLITTWIAPISEEKAMHKLFENKRVRGEWFKLNFSDLKLIKEYMGKYKNTE